MKARVTVDDFFTALIAELAASRVTVVSLRANFDQALEEAFNELLEAGVTHDLDVRFRIRTHPVHGDSPTVRDALAAAVQRDLISLDNPEYQDMRLKVTQDDAEDLLGRTTIPRDLAERMSKTFLERYRLLVN